MNLRPLNILLLGENQSGWASLQRQLEKRSCRCWLGRSAKEAVALTGARDYDLILTSIPVAQIDACLAELGGFQPNVFYCHPVEDGCWWLPVVRHGRKCFGAPGVRGAEFPGVLDQIIRDRGPQPASDGDPKAPFQSASRG